MMDLYPHDLSTSPYPGPLSSAPTCRPSTPRSSLLESPFIVVSIVHGDYNHGLA